MGWGRNSSASVMVNLSLAGVEEVYVTVAHHLAEEFAAVARTTGFYANCIERDRYGNGRHEVVSATCRREDVGIAQSPPVDRPGN